MIVDEIFARKIPIYKELITYGFEASAIKTRDDHSCSVSDVNKYHPAENTQLTYREPIMDGDLIVEVSAVFPDDAGHGKPAGDTNALSQPSHARSPQVTSRALDAETGDEYALIDIASSSGAYVGRARDEYRAVLTRIADACCLSTPFGTDQANRITYLIRKAYGVQPDFPFATYPDAGVFRHAGGGKWFALMMPLERKKLEAKDAVRKQQLIGGSSAPQKADKRARGEQEIIDIMNIKIDPDRLEDLLKEPGIYTCYHMNKKLWVTLAMDESLSDAHIMELIADSFARTEGGSAGRRKTGAADFGDRKGRDGKPLSCRSYWIIPSNPATFDVGAGFEASGDDTLTWHHRIKSQPGDYVYIYQTNPVAALIWRCEVIACDGAYTDQKRSDAATSIMYLKRLETFEPDRYPRSWLNDHGIKKTVRGQRRAPAELVIALETGA